MKKVIFALLAVAALFGFNSISAKDAGVIRGKVVKAYVQRGYGRRGVEWLFMDVKTKDKVYHVGIAPSFVIPNLPVNEGDEVEVRGFTPPYWPNDTVKAWDIYDVTQKKDYPIAGYGRGLGWRWR